MSTTMSKNPDEPFRRVEVITSVQRRRRWSVAEKVRLVEEAMQPGMSVSYVARRAGVSPSQLFAWKRRMLEGGQAAVHADEDVVGASQVRELEKRVRDLERMLGKKTMEAEILKEALDLRSEEAMQPGMSVSYVARRAGVSPSQLFAWKRRMLEGGQAAVHADEDVVGASQVRELEKRVRDLERMLGKKTMEAEILKEALDL